MEIAEKLKKLRTDRSLTQKDLSDRLSISKKTYVNWEQGRYIPTVGNLTIVADFYGVPVSFLLDGAQTREPSLSEAANTVFQDISSNDINALTPSQKKAVYAILSAFVDDNKRK